MMKILSGGLLLPLATLLATACSPAPRAKDTPSGDRASPAATAVPATQTANAEAPLVTVYKSPTCGCCAAWVEYMRKNGFRVETNDLPDVAPIKAQYGVPNQLASCHTARVGNYTLEGHVPAEEIRRLLREQPADVAGLAVPGMVMGSPGMEGPNPQTYDVVAFRKDGQTSLYAEKQPK